MVSSNSENNKRVAKNTLFLYFRMILIMLVTLYTSRVILAELGIKDYGIYNVVGGVVTMFSFINNCMTTSTQRFLTFALGKRDLKRLKDIFATSLNIHIIIGLLIIFLAETIGLWFVNNKLVISEDRIIAANWAYQFSILTFCVNIIQVPYNAVLIAHEKMNIYAYISILEVILKLLIVYLLTIVKTDKLIVYGILVFSVQLIIRAIYQFYCKKKFEECKFRLFWNKCLYKQMSSFAGWNLLGSIAWLLQGQGLNIVLNLFFGPVVNAARGIASQVSSAVMNFISNFQVALNPQITKSYASDNIDNMEKLSYLGIKFSFLLLFTMAFPLCLNINYILHIWLVDVPNYTEIFIILIMMDSLLGSLFGGPLMTSISATGNIRNYQIFVNSIILCILPVSYFILKLGFDAPSVFCISIIFNLISGFIRFLFCRSQIGYSLKKYISRVLLPISMVSILSLPVPILLKIYCFRENSFLNTIYLCVITLFITISISWFFCMTKNERTAFIATIKNKFQTS